MRAVPDTSVLIATGLPSLDGDLGVSVVSMAELHYGVLVAADRDVRGERLRRLTALRDLFEPIPVDDAVATSYGLLASAVAGVGRSPRPRSMDILIAATAHAHADRLYTRNAGDLVGLERELEIVAV